MSEKNTTEQGTDCSVKGCRCKASRHRNMCIAHLAEYQDSAIVRSATYPKPDDASKTGS